MLLFRNATLKTSLCRHRNNNLHIKISRNRYQKDTFTYAFETNNYLQSYPKHLRCCKRYFGTHMSKEDEKKCIIVEAIQPFEESCLNRAEEISQKLKLPLFTNFEESERKVMSYFTKSSEQNKCAYHAAFILQVSSMHVQLKMITCKEQLTLLRDKGRKSKAAKPLISFCDFGRLLRETKHSFNKSNFLHSIRVKKIPVSETRVLDATGGFARDAFILAKAGFQVFIAERNPILHTLIKDGIDRAKNDPNVASIANRMMLLPEPSDSIRWMEIQSRDIKHHDVHPLSSKIPELALKYKKLLSGDFIDKDSNSHNNNNNDNIDDDIEEMEDKEDTEQREYLQVKRWFFPFDVVYLDPMYPLQYTSKRRKESKSLPRAEISLIRALLSTPHDQFDTNNTNDIEDLEKMISTAKMAASNKIVIKRPHYAPQITSHITRHSYPLRDTHYDVIWSDFRERIEMTKSIKTHQQ